jgi:tripartite-type tricarboxylate transporter receptor subunit TctC
MKRTSIALAIGTAITLLSVPMNGASADESYPSRPIQLILPSGAGGGTDISMRKLASLVEPALGQKIIVVNKPGSGGVVGMEAIVGAKPDGYTLGGIWNAPLTMTPHLFKVSYDTSSYTPISMSTQAGGVLCVHPDFPATSGAEFIAELKKNPSKYTYGDDGVGGTFNVTVERIFKATGASARAIPFSGASETLKTFLGGDIDIYSGTIPPVLPFVKSGEAKCLLLTSAERSSSLPDVDSLADIGVPDAATVQWRGIIAPVGVPDAVAKKLESAFMQGAQSDEFKSFMEDDGEEAVGSDAATMRKRIDDEYAAMGAIMKEMGLDKHTE